MVTTDRRKSLRDLQDYILSGSEATGYKMNVVGEIVATELDVIEFISNNTSTTHTLGATSKAVSFSNDGASSIIFTIGGVAITLLANEVFDGDFADFTEIITTNASSVAYRIVVFG